MREPLILKFQDQDVRVIQLDGENYIPAEDLGHILGFNHPQPSIFKIFERHREELEPHSTIVKMTAADGKLREVRVFNETGAYLVAMFARTPKAKEVRLWLARLPRLVRERGSAVIEAALRQALDRAFSLVEDLLLLDRETVERLVWLRDRAGLTQVEAARVLGISRWDVQRIEKRLREKGILLPTINRARRRREMQRYFLEKLTGTLPRAAQDRPAELSH